MLMDISMKIRSENCRQCQGNQFEDHYTPLEFSCQHCGFEDQITFEVGAQNPRELNEVSLINPFRIFAIWHELINTIAADSTLFSLCTCKNCDKIVMVKRKTPIGLACAFCSTVSEYPISSEIMDAYPNGTIQQEKKILGSGYNIKIWPDPKITSVDQDIHCPSCSSLVPAFEGTTSCEACGKEMFAISACGNRVLSGFQVRGYIKRPEGVKRIDGWDNHVEFEKIYTEALEALNEISPAVKIVLIIFGLVFAFIGAVPIIIIVVSLIIELFGVFPI